VPSRWTLVLELKGKIFFNLERFHSYKSRALEMENIGLRRNTEALKSELYVYKGVTRSHHSEALSNDGNGWLASTVWRRSAKRR
jgi:hypothetical protein